MIDHMEMAIHTVKLLFLFGLILFPLHKFHSVPMHPDLMKRLKAEEKLDETLLRIREAKVKGVEQPNPNPPKWEFKGKQVDQPAIVILVEFRDNLADSIPDHYEDMLFSLDTYPTGSLRDYYRETSYDQLDITGTVTLWLTMPENYTYYVDGQNGFGSYPRNAQKLAEDAVLTADPSVDFSTFDADGDGYVDALFVVHAGPGAEVTGDPNDIWSHAWSTYYPILLDGVYVYNYSMEPEDGKIGVFAHELGHVFGLPDLYDYGYDSQGVGFWSIMAAGAWGGGGAKPVHFDGWSKCDLGFVTPLVLTSNLTNASIPEVELIQVVYKLWSNGTGTTQYFLVENRRKIGFDQYIRGEGLLIYHVDETVPNNNNQNHYRVAVEQADGRFDLEENRNSGDSGDPWPGVTTHRTFCDTSVPDSRDYDFEPTWVAVLNVSNSADTMTADLMVTKFAAVLVTAANDTVGTMHNNLTVTFNLLNASIYEDTFDVLVNDTQGWPLNPNSLEVSLKGDTDSLLLIDISIPLEAMIGTVDTVLATAISRIDTALSDSDSLTVTVEVICGDCNADGRITGADATYITSFIHRGGLAPIGEGDVNLDGRITGADATYIVYFIYRGGPPPCEPSSKVEER